MANRQSLNQLFNSFVTSLGLILDEGIDGAVVQELNQATIGFVWSDFSAAWTHLTRILSVRSLSDSLKFLVVHFSLFLHEAEGDFVSELDKEIDEVAVSPVFVKGFCMLFDPPIPSRSKRQPLWYSPC